MSEDLIGRAHDLIWFFRPLVPERGAITVVILGDAKEVQLLSLFSGMRKSWQLNSTQNFPIPKEIQSNAPGPDQSCPPSSLAKEIWEKD